MCPAFSSSEKDVLERVVGVSEAKVTPLDHLEEIYEINRCVKWISDNNYREVALQFPDSLLPDSADVALLLKDQLENTEVFILGDTSYGSCCVDEVAAEHAEADAIIHFGHSCLSETRRLPVLYIFTKRPLAVEDCVESFRNAFPDKDTYILLIYEVFFSYYVDDILKHLEPEYNNLLTSRLQIPGHQGKELEKCCSVCVTSSSGKHNTSICGRAFCIPEKLTVTYYKVFFIGEEGKTSSNFTLLTGQSSYTAYSPIHQVANEQNVRLSNFLMKRYYLVERTKDAQVVGVLVGTLGVAEYMAAISRLKQLCKAAGKKCYTFVVGKPNIAKLANFPEVDIYVIVSCLENSLLDSKEFYKPVITPYELEVACNPARKWTGSYVLDFKELLPGGSAYVELNLEARSESDVSLITGRARNVTLGQEDREKGSGDEVALRGDMAVSVVHVGGGGEFLANRSWQGLQPNVGDTEASLATVGESGRAQGYKSEILTLNSDQTEL